MNAVNSRPHALVIGAGVSGLTTAFCLRQGRMAVTVLAEEFMPRITSAVAGALWEWPPAVCGYHHDEVSLERSKHWCMVSYRAFEQLAAVQECGVHLRPVTFYFRNRLEEHALHLSKMEQIRARVPGFRRDPQAILRNGVNRGIGLVDAYEHLAPMVDTDRYMRWLLAQLQAEGVRVLQRRIHGSLRELEPVLRREFAADVIVNCTGLGARELTGEAMYPLRGALVRLVNDGRRFPRLTQAHCISHDHITGADEIVFIVPRGDNRVVLGALAEPDQWGRDIGLDNHAPIRAMYRRCIEFLPMLAAGEIDALEPVRVGLRPFRKNNVRLAPEPGTGIIHNYAHGGAGVTFSWGCAMEVAGRVQQLIDAGRSRFADGPVQWHAQEVRLPASVFRAPAVAADPR